MNGPDDNPADRELLPEGVPSFDDPAYRGLSADLAALGDTGPMPAEVAARLDAVIAGLGGSRVQDDPEDADAPEDAVVEPLPARRRTRTGQRLLAAAAVVVVVGAGGTGLAKVLQDRSGPSHSQSTTAAADSAGKGTESLNPAALPPASPGVLGAAAVPQRMSTSRFASQAASFLRGRDSLTGLALAGLDARSNPPTSGSATSGGGAPTTLAPSATSAPEPATPAPGTVAPDSIGRSPAAVGSDGVAAQNYAGIKDQSTSTCSPVVAGANTVPILLDGRPAVLVVYPAVAGKRLVEARDCSGKTVLVSAHVPA